MGNTQKRAQMPGSENAGKAIGSRNAPAARASARNIKTGNGSAGHNEQVLPRDAASYIHEMAIEMKDIAETARLSFLAYLLDLVIEESGVQKRGRL